MRGCPAVTEGYSKSIRDASCQVEQASPVRRGVGLLIQAHSPSIDDFG
jgi:hypothetical protein